MFRICINNSHLNHRFEYSKNYIQRDDLLVEYKEDSSSCLENQDFQYHIRSHNFQLFVPLNLCIVCSSVHCTLYTVHCVHYTLDTGQN